MSFFDKDEFANFNFDEFLSFRKLITPVIIKIVYLLGVAGIVLFGLFMMFNGIHSFVQFLVQLLIGIGIIIFGNISWRISCEVMMVIFNIYSELKKQNK